MSEEEGELPLEFCCPISGEVFVDPVVAADGHTYERAFIVRWLLHKASSPMTNAPLASRSLFPNHALKSLLVLHQGGASTARRRRAPLLAELEGLERAPQSLPSLAAFPAEFGGRAPPPCSYPGLVQVNGGVLFCPGLPSRQIAAHEWPPYECHYLLNLDDPRPSVVPITSGPLPSCGLLLACGFEVLLLGGVSFVEFGRRLPLQQLARKVQVFSQQWDVLLSAPDPQAGHPPGRSCFAAASSLEEACIFLFGGSLEKQKDIEGHEQDEEEEEEEDGDVGDDLWKLDVARKAWERIPRAPENVLWPAGRLYHAGICARGQFFIFGGAPDAKTTIAGDVVFDDLWVYMPASRSWKQLAKGPSPRGSTCLLHLPPPFAHMLLLFGGFNGQVCLSDAWVYDMDQDKWTALGNVLPVPRAAFAAVIVQNRILVYGGFSMEGEDIQTLLLHIS